jgi:hypothetical protein
MQKSNDLTLKEAMELMLKRYKLEQRVTETDILKSWIKAMGAFVAGNTVKVEFYKSKAVIYLKSAVMRKEYSMEKDKIIEILNEELGGNLITEIEFR